VEETRVDRWIWSVRIVGTRTAATEACRGGHVDLNRVPAKPASRVRRGDRVTVRLHGRLWELEVVTVIDRRVGAPTAATCYVDHSPPVATREAPVVFARDASSGRPTKRDRRRLDELRQDARTSGGDGRLSRGARPR